MSFLFHTCPRCCKTYIPDLLKRGKEKGELGKGYTVRDYENATPAEREQLISGICSDECWDELLGPEVD